MSLSFIQHLLENERDQIPSSTVEAGDKIWKLLEATFRMLEQTHGQAAAANYILQNILSHLTQHFEELRSSEGVGDIGAEEEESNMPARRDREKVSQGIRNRTPNERGSIRSGKRNAQKAGRHQRSMHGKGTGGGNYMDNLFGKGGRPEDY